MHETLRLREESDQTAKLQDLLSRLQTPEVDGEFGGVLDVLRKSTNSLSGITRAKVLKMCVQLWKDQQTTTAKLPVDTKNTLEEFMILLEIKSKIFLILS
jgi:hypothetical protein